MIIHQGKTPNPMEVVLTSQSLICKYQKVLKEFQNHEHKPKQQAQQIPTRQDW